jgi:glycosyltransferase involved in cell wall biosynthesis
VTASELRLGFACNWASDRRRTWSGTPWHLHRELGRLTEVENLDLSPSRLGRIAWRSAFARPGHKGPSPWKHSRAWLAHVERELARQVAASTCDAVVEIGDLGVIDRPFFLLQDLSFDILLGRMGPDGVVPHFPGLGREALLRLRDRQHRIYDRAEGVLAMSRWLADHLVEEEGLPPERVHVVHPGMAAEPPTTGEPLPERPRRALLFVGRDFHVKAGGVVVDAVEIIRRDHPDVTLTVVGPRRWPLDGEPPPGVRFLGARPAEEVAQLYREHDLLVMPSLLEGFGMVFVEALARGVPCIGRADCAMPELITPGDNGDLVTSNDPRELAAKVMAVLGNAAIYENCAGESAAVAEHFRWSRAATETLTIVQASIGQLPIGARTTAAPSSIRD